MGNSWQGVSLVMHHAQFDFMMMIFAMDAVPACMSQIQMPVCVCLSVSSTNLLGEQHGTDLVYAMPASYDETRKCCSIELFLLEVG